MILSQLHISFLSRANVPEAIQPCMTTLPLHLTPSCANILGASTAGFAAPYQLFNFPGSTTSSFLEAAACQAAAIFWSRVDRAHCGRIKPCTLSEKVLFLVLLFLFFSPTLRNSSYSNWLPLPAWGMENNFFFSVWGRKNGTVTLSCCQQENGPWVTAQALGMGFGLQGSGAAEILDIFPCYSQRKQQRQGEADRLHFCKIVFFLGSFSLVCLWGGKVEFPKWAGVKCQVHWQKTH